MANFVQPMDRNLYLSVGVTRESISELTKSIVSISENDEKLKGIYGVYGLTYTPNPIKLYIDSPGGTVYQCFGMLNIIQNSTTPVHTIVTGEACSAAFIIAASGSKRFAYDKSTFMYHQASGMNWGEVKTMEEQLAEVTRLQSMMEDFVISNTKITKKQLKHYYDTKTDWYMDSKEALSLGVIDEIIKR
jgi:ATP-dependent Clp protease protease subunit